MKTALKMIHTLGLILFLGSILSFVVASALTQGATLQELAFARNFISTGTAVLTLPGMWMTILSGLALAYLSGRLGQGWVKAKLALSGFVALNAHLLIVTAAKAATSVAAESVHTGVLAAGYQAAYMRESAFGAVNVLLTLALMVLATRKRTAMA